MLDLETTDRHRQLTNFRKFLANYNKFLEIFCQKFPNSQPYCRPQFMASAAPSDATLLNRIEILPNRIEFAFSQIAQLYI